LVLAACKGGEVLQQSTGPVTRQYDIATLLESVSRHGVSLSPDGSMLVTSSDESGIFNLVGVSLSTEAKAAPLTTSTTASNLLVGDFPDDDRILFTADQGGNELAHVYVRESNGTVRDLTRGDGHIAEFHGWASDGKSFFYRSNARLPQAFDVHEVSLDGYTQ